MRRRSAKYKRPILDDPWAVKGRDILAMSILFGLMMGGVAFAAFM